MRIVVSLLTAVCLIAAAEASATGVSTPQSQALPSAPKPGTIVMEAMAERSVDGTVDLDYAPSGVTWRLTCPAANALET